MDTLLRLYRQLCGEEFGQVRRTLRPSRASSNVRANPLAKAASMLGYKNMSWTIGCDICRSADTQVISARGVGWT
ncbi:hypothetical protein AB0H57_29975 [Micromonospora sp. NPDC050686]|uniref:hypothetical protein n=1 Tax=Micromonospora sp. NPDC050686 TaxID=3154631 RepID=UPI0033EC2622